MRPITDALPKPLIEVRGKPLIVWHLENLAAAGFREVIINVSHLGFMLERALGDGERWGVHISWSRETEALETAGGIAFARALLGEAPFALINADVYCDYPFAELRSRCNAASLGHLVLVSNPHFRPGGDFSLTDGVVGNAHTPRYTYSGIGAFAPRLLDGISPGTKAPLAPLLRQAASLGQLSGELHTSCWNDVGTPQRLAELNQVKPS